MPWHSRPRSRHADGGRIGFSFGLMGRAGWIAGRRALLAIGLMMAVLTVSAQTVRDDAQVHSEDMPVDMDSPTFVPMVKVSKVMHEGDSIPFMEMNNVYVYPQLVFKNAKQANNYMRLVRNVKIVLPIAKEVNSIILETYEFLETLPDKKAKEEHMTRVEKCIMEQYKPRMKKLTYSQGKLLIKLIYRECNSSSYDILKAFLGPIRAGFWQAFSSIFGASLKKEYNAEGTDRLTERVVRMVEAGQI